MQTKKKLSDIRFAIVCHLQKADRPLIMNHIAKGINVRPQSVEYHLSKLTEEGVVLVQSQYGHNYYFLQPIFYMEDAETVLMKLLMPWIKKFAEETETEEQDKTQVVINNLSYYFQLFFNSIRKNIT